MDNLSLLILSLANPAAAREQMAQRLRNDPEFAREVWALARLRAASSKSKASSR